MPPRGARAAVAVLAAAATGATCRASLATSKPLEVATWAAWPSFPQSLLLEASEFLAEEDPSGRLFWAFADAVWGSPAAAGGVLGDAAAATDAAFSLAAGLVEPLTYDVLRLAVQSRAYSPAVEMQRQLCAASPARAACSGAAAWAELSTGEAACDAGALATLAARPAPPAGDDAALPLFEGDHRYDAATPALALAAEARPLVVVCGSLGDADAGALHAAAAAAASAGALRYVWRHCPAAGARNATWLAGYGVGLDVKSTEYKFMDDAVAGGSGAGAGGAAAAAFAARVAAADGTLPPAWLAAAAAAPAAGGSVLGIDVDALERRAAEAAAAGDGDGPAPPSPAAFNRLRAALAAAAAADAAGASTAAAAAAAAAGAPPLSEARVEPWEAADLGLQATAWITSGGGGGGGVDDDALTRLDTLVSNFPSLAPHLASLPVSDGLRAEAAANARLVAPGTSLMTVNGIAVEPSAPTFNFFALLNVLRSEARVAAAFAALPLAAEDRRRVAALAIAGSKEATEAAAAAAKAAAAAAGGGDDDSGGDEDNDELTGARGGGPGGGGGAAGGVGTVRVDVWVDAEADFLLRPDAPHPYPVIAWLNDVEDGDDDAFKRWPTSLRALLAPAWQLHSIKRNLYNVFFAGDLASPSGLRALSTAAYFVGAHVPVRFGVLPLPASAGGDDGAADGAAPLGVDRAATLSGLQLALLHAAAVTAHGADAAGDFVIRLGAAWRADLDARTRDAVIAAGGDPDAPRGPGSPPPPAVPDAGVTVDAAVAAYAAAVAAVTGAWSDDDAIAEAEAALADAGGALRRLVRHGADWAAARGLPTPCTVLNGRVTPGLDVQGGGFMPLIGEEMGALQRAVAGGSLDDAVAPSVYAALLGRATAVNAKQARAAARRAAAAGGAPPPSPPATRVLASSGLIAPVFQPAVFAPDDAQRFLALSAPDAAPLRAAARYVSAPGTGDDVKPVSVTVFDDLDTAEGLAALAAALSFVRGGGDGATTPTLRAPRHLVDGIASALRVAPLHVPVLHTSAPASTSPSVGRLLAGAWAVATGACRAESAAGPLAHFNLRLDDAGPLLADAVDAAWGAVAAGGDARAAQRAIAAAWAAAAAGGGASARGASKLAAALPAIAAAAFDAAGDAAQHAACLADALRSSDAVADAARRLIPAALPEARVPAAGGGMRVRAVAANGRLLALGDPRGGACAVAGGGNASSIRLIGAAPSPTPAGGAPPPPSLASLPACISPSDVAILVMAERAARGAPVAALLSTVTEYPNVDPDDATAEWVSGVVAQAAAAVGASLQVQSGNLGGRAVGRSALRTQLLAEAHTRFVATRAAPATDGDGGASNGGGGGDATLHVTAIVDPLSEDATRIAPLLRLLRDRLGAVVTVHLVPPPRAPPQPPLRSFYRFVMPADYRPTAVAAGGQLPPPAAAAWERPTAAFAWLPPSSILTMKHYVPEAWNTQAAAADVDLDNLRLADVPAAVGAVAVEYALRDILVAGQCVDVTAGGGAGAAFPNGLQLTLTEATGRGGAVGVPQSDTLVMQNLGYWQLKAATPGVFAVGLAAGRGATLYDVVVPASTANASGWAAASGSGASGGGGYSHPMMGRRGGGGGGGAGEPAALVVAPSLPVVVRDFTGPIAQLSVRKKPGMEAIPLLAPIGGAGGGEDGEAAHGVEVAPDAAQGGSGGGLLSGLSRRLFGDHSHHHAAPAAPQTTNVTAAVAAAADGVDARPPLHVFSLASGHLYERFLKIMMLSAVKRTPGHRLTFWLLENTLSPAFKRAVPALTSRHAFDVRYVTYKWPNWLRQQSEKQRIIWGYKILFLDVLFPLNLTKVIYVDSDQVVRADLGELWSMDLHGAPYAYTPFCDSRKETLGYQFWRSGYWADHLAGKPYHISALYVVDLAAFRRAAVGDTLRSVYDTLSRDPNSLSNLDQDLPNYAQSLVPIHSLPQEWLWCESWCSDDSKAQAKTIDLCNNPRFKEPKLDMAKRVISGGLFPESWVQLDEEVKADEAAFRGAGGGA